MLMKAKDVLMPAGRTSSTYNREHGIQTKVQSDKEDKPCGRFIDELLRVAAERIKK